MLEACFLPLFLLDFRSFTLDGSGIRILNATSVIFVDLKDIFVVSIWIEHLLHLKLHARLLLFGCHHLGRQHRQQCIYALENKYRVGATMPASLRLPILAFVNLSKQLGVNFRNGLKYCRSRKYSTIRSGRSKRFVIVVDRVALEPDRRQPEFEKVTTQLY